MHNRTLRKRENAFQLKKAIKEQKDTECLAARLQQSDGMHFGSSTVHTVLKLLLLTTAVSAVLPPAHAVDVEVPTAAPSDSSSDTSTFETDDFRFTNTTTRFEKVYKHNPEKFETDKRQVKGLIRAATRTSHATACKFKSIAADKTFHIALTDQEELGMNVAGRFLTSKNELQIIPKRTTTLDDRITVRHEAHHAFIAHQNKLADRFLQPEKKYHMALPHDPENMENLRPILDEGIRNVKKILKLLDKEKLSPREQEKLNKYKQAAAAYEVPYEEITLTDADIRDMRTNDAIDKNFKILKGIRHTSHPVASLYFQSIHVTKDGKKIGRIGVVRDPTDKLRGALLDYYRFVEVALPTLYADDKVLEDIELDAHVHEKFDPHPALFKLLFPQLNQHHAERSDERFRACMRL